MINEKSADTQLELKKRIEEKTAAKVHFEPRFSAEEQFTARIVWEHLFIDEDGDLAKELIELSFIADQPRKKPMTEAQISAYPPELQNCFRSLFPDESCNVLPAVSIADTPEKALEELLEMAGISPLSQDPKDRLTWESIVEMAQQVMKAAEDNGMNGIWGFEFDQINSPYELLPLVESLGGKAIGDDGLTVKGVLDTPEWVEAAKFYGDIHNTYNIAPKGVNRYEIWQLFQSGKLAFMVAGSYYYAQLEGSDVDWGIAPMPYFEGGKAITATGSMHLAVASTTNHPEEAANVVKLMTLGYGNDIYMPIKQSLPARKTLAEGIMTDPKYEEFPANSYRLFSYEIQNTSVPRPSTVAYTEYESTFNTTFEDIRNGLNAEECLDNMVSQLDSMIQKYR